MNLVDPLKKVMSNLNRIRLCVNVTLTKQTNFKNHLHQLNIDLKAN